MRCSVGGETYVLIHVEVWAILAFSLTLAPSQGVGVKQHPIVTCAFVSFCSIFVCHSIGKTTTWKSSERMGEMELSPHGATQVGDVGELQ